MKHPEDLQPVTTYAIRNQIRLIRHCPFTGVFDSPITPHCGELGQLVYAGEDRLHEIVRSLGVFEGDVAGLCRAFSSHSTRIPAPATCSHGRHLLIACELARVGVFHSQFDLRGQCLFVFDVVTQNIHRQIVHALARSARELDRSSGRLRDIPLMAISVFRIVGKLTP